jgi:hypothetical protein
MDRLAVDDSSPPRTKRAGNVTTENGMPIELEEPSTLCINAHIESGSGVMNLGKGFEVQCNATFDILEFK